MTVNIFRFWAKIKPHQKIHPADSAVFRRLGRDGHGLDLRCLPGSFSGPLRRAPVVLLYLSPGLSAPDFRHARTAAGQKRYAQRRKGNAPLWAADEHPRAHKWWVSRTKAFGIDPAILRRKLAVLNIGAYHSKRFTDYPLLASLPSSRVSLEWAQNVLFPQAMRGERVVICLRAAHFWGLAEGHRYGRALFAPRVTRGGHMRNKTRRERKMRTAVISAVRKAILKKQD